MKSLLTYRSHCLLFQMIYIENERLQEQILSQQISTIFLTLPQDDFRAGEFLAV